MDLPKIRTVVHDPSQPDGDRLVLLRMANKCTSRLTLNYFPINKSDGLCKPADIPPQAQEFLDKEARGLVDYQIELNYDYWTAGMYFNVRTISS